MEICSHFNFIFISKHITFYYCMPSKQPKNHQLTPDLRDSLEAAETNNYVLYMCLVWLLSGRCLFNE